MCFFRKTLLSVCIVLPCAAWSQPVAVNDDVSTPEDTQIVFDILANDDATPNSLAPETVDLDPSTPLTEDQLISIAEGDFTVDNAGVVTFTPAPDFNGDAVITYTVKNDEITPQTSAPATITVTVTAVNDPPSFTKGGDELINEDAGPQTVLIWATNIMDGDDGSQMLTFNVTNDNTALFTPGGQPSITSGGDLSYEPAANASGSATVSVVLTDDGGDVLPDVNESVEETFEITVDPLNDAPVFTPGTDVTVYENAGPQTINAWATGIDDGDPESDQGLSFTVDNDNSALFLVQPAISELTGDLTFESAVDAFGTATVTVTLVDDGPDVLPEVNASAPVMFDITVNPVNNAPSFTKGADESILEDAGPQTVVSWATNIMDGDGGTQMLSFVVNNDNGVLFSTPPSITSAGDLSYEVAADASGAAVVSVTLMDDGDDVLPSVNVSAEQTFNITVDPVNDAPVFTAGSDVSVYGSVAHTVSSWATAMDDGDAESDQGLSFTVVNDNNALFLVQPAISETTGDLTFTPATVANGSATVTVTLVDDGSDVAPNVNSSVPLDFMITIDAINDPPTFTAGGNQVVNEDAGPQTVLSWATGMDDGDALVSQTLTFIASNDNNTLFSAQPSIDASGTLTYTPADDANGSAMLTVTLSDDGASAPPPNNNTSASQNFMITINAINDAPTFTKGGDQTVDEDAGAQNIPLWATNIDDGDPDVTQTLTFNVSNDNNALFSTQPTIDASGTLSYALNANTNGSATVTVTLSDDGASVPPPNIDTSPPLNFTITVNPINDAPTFAKGMDQVIDEDAGLQTIPGWATGIDDGDAGVSQVLTFTVTNDNNGLFSIQPAINATTGTLTYRPADNANGSATVSVILSDDGSGVAPNVNTTVAQSFFINVNAIDDTPTISSLMDQTIDENTETGALEFTIGDAETPATLLTLIPMSSNTMLVDNTDVVLGGMGSMRNVNVIPKLNQFGMTTITLTVTDGLNTALTAFQVFVTEVDVAPTITPLGDQVINEDNSTGALAFSVADVDTGLGSLVITASSDNQLLIPDGNISIVANGGGGADWTIEVSPLPNTNSPAQGGAALITIDVFDGVDHTFETFTVTVNAVNDVPSFTKGADQSVNEDVTAQTVNGWATAINDGDPDLTQTISFNVTNDNNSLFNVQPTISAAGNLTYTPQTNANGTANVTVSVSDNGSNVAPNVNTSATQMFTIDVVAINDAPSFTKGADQSILEGAGAQTVNGWATSISDGDPEVAQALTFNVSNDNNGLFTSQPAISAAGVLTYTALASANGVANVTVTLSDNGSNVAPNVNTSAAQAFVITVNAINDAPSFTKGADQSVQEDVGAQIVSGWATNIDDGDTELVQGLTFDVSNTNNSLFLVQPAITSGGDLSFTPAANATGSAVVSVTLMDDGSGVAPNVNTSAQQTFNITITPLNDAPVFTPGGNVMVDEGAGAQTINGWATSIDDGDSEFTQTVSFTVGNNNNALFLVQPAISVAGNLMFTPAAGANGSANVTVTLVDNGSGIAPNVNSSAPVNFTITVNAINDPPVFTAGANQVVNEDAGAQTVAGWATGIDDGDPGVTQVLTFIVSNNNTTLFATQPSLSAAGTLTYMPANNANGIATVTVTLSDNGASAPPPNDNTSAPQMFTITINPINDVPTFTTGADQAANENAALQTVAGWATGIDDGDPELTQTLTFNVNNDNNALFMVQPSINASGDLTYRPATDANGSAMVSVSLSDNGSSAAPNVNTSAVQTFMITINNINNPPVFTAGANQTVDEDAGLQTVTNWATGIDDGDPEVTQTLTFNVSNDNNVLFSAQPTINASGTLSYTPATNANGSANVTVVLTDNGAGSPPPNSNTSATQMFTITVNAINDPPTISAIGNTIINEDSQTGTIPFTISDPETAAGSLIVSASSDNTTLVPNANIVLAGSGGTRTVNVTPAPDENGVVNVTITVSDGTNTAMTSFQVTVNAVNDAPVITAHVPITINEVEPVVLSVSQLTIVDPDDIYPDGFELFVISGTNYSVSGTTVTPVPNFSGVLTVPVFVNDGEATSFPPFNLQITVNSTNDAPVITGQQAITINEDQTYSVGFGDLTVNDPDNTYPDDFTLSLSPGPNYTFTGTTVTPAANYNGTLLVNVKVNDGSLDSNPFSLQLSITPVNDPPVITAQSPLSTNEDTPLPLVVGNFTVVDPEPTTYTLTVDPTPGTNYTVSGNTVTPNPDFFGTISVPVTVSDGTVSSVVFNAQITVNSVNDAPVITGQTSLTTVEDTPITLQLTDLTVTDVDNLGYPTGFSLNIQAGSDYTFSGTTVTPGPDYVGPIFVSVRVNDGTTNSAPYLVQIDVTDDSDAPIITGQNVVSMNEDESLELTTANLVIVDPDTPDDQQTLIILDGANYTYVGTTLSPNPNYFGTLTVNVQVNDGLALSNLFPLQVTVNPVNDAPSFSAIANMTIPEDAPLQSVVINNISAGPMETSQTMLISFASSNPSLIPVPVATYNGTATMATMTFKPAANMFGTSDITVTVVDNNFEPFERTFTVTVTSVNDKPTLPQVTVDAINEGSPLQIIPLTGITPGGGPSESDQTLELIVLSVTNGELLENQPSITYQSPQTTGSLNVLPEVNAFGTVTITLQLKDSGPGSPPPNTNTTTMTVTIVINPVNDIPEFDSEPPMNAEVGVAYQYNIEVSDADNETITITAPTIPAWLTLTQGTNGKATLSGMPLTSETVQVILEAKDPSGATTQQDYMLTVNSRPVVSPISISLNEDVPYDFSAEDFASGFFDADGNTIAEIEITALPTRGTLRLNNVPVTVGQKIQVSIFGTLTYVPKSDSVGMDSFKWNGADGLGLYALTDTDANITVNPINDPPIITALETDSLHYELGSEVPVFMTTTFDAYDPDKGDLITSAEIGFLRIGDFRYSEDNDVLSFPGTPKISGVFTQGVLTLSGSATAAEYVAAIRSITYNFEDTKEIIDEPRGISITLSDGKAQSLSKTRIIKLIYTFSDLDIPTAFTPNGDFANETWQITSLNGTDQYSDAEIKIYNKRGLLLFEGTGFESPWNGVFNGEVLPADTYFYTIDLKYNRVRYKGTVTILR